MAKLTIGGVIYEVAPLGFKKIRAAAPLLKAAQDLLASNPDLIGVTDAAFEIMRIAAIAIDKPDVTAESLEAGASFTESQGLVPFLNDLMEESGLSSPKGEAPGAAADLTGAP